MNQDEGNGGEINEARLREAQVRTITYLNQVVSTSTNRMEWIEIALGNHQGREILLNEGVENEEDDNVTLLAGHSPRVGEKESNKNYEKPIEMWEELKTLMRKIYNPKHYSRVPKQKL